MMSGHRQIHGGNEHTERINKLTPREKQALELASAPLGSKEIAEQLGISKLTVDRYIADAVTKLGAQDRKHACRIYRESAPSKIITDFSGMASVSRSGQNASLHQPTTQFVQFGTDADLADHESFSPANSEQRQTHGTPLQGWKLNDLTIPQKFIAFGASILIIALILSAGIMLLDTITRFDSLYKP